MRPNQAAFPSSQVASRSLIGVAASPPLRGGECSRSFNGSVRFVLVLRLSIPQIPHGGCAIQPRFDASTHHTKRHDHRKPSKSSHVGNGYNGSFAHLLSLSHLHCGAYCPAIAGMRLLTMASKAGPSITMKTPGKMKSTIGTIILIASLAACSSARCLRLVRRESENVRRA